MLKAGVPPAAGVRDRCARAQQRALLAPHDGHQGQDRGGIVDVAGVSRASRAVRQALLQPGRRGEASGTIDAILDRLATYKEKILAIKGKIKSALFYPISVIVVAIVVTWIIMVFVIPSFKKVFANFGADLPRPRSSSWRSRNGSCVVVARRGHHRRHHRRHRRDVPALGSVQAGFDRLLLKIPVIGGILEKGDDRALDTQRCRRCSRPASPLVESLDAARRRYPATRCSWPATRKIQTEVSTGTSLTNADDHTGPLSPRWSCS
jgi:type IV pilus assembly protein PilC